MVGLFILFLAPKQNCPRSERSGWDIRLKLSPHRRCRVKYRIVLGSWHLNICFMFKTSLAKPTYGVVQFSGTSFETGFYTSQQSNILVAMEMDPFEDAVSFWQRAIPLISSFLECTRWAPDPVINEVITPFFTGWNNPSCSTLYFSAIYRGPTPLKGAHLVKPIKHYLTTALNPYAPKWDCNVQYYTVHVSSIYGKCIGKYFIHGAFG